MFTVMPSVPHSACEDVKKMSFLGVHALKIPMTIAGLWVSSKAAAVDRFS